MRSTRLALSLAVCAVMIATLPAASYAQGKSRSEGFFLGVSLEGDAVSVEDSDTTDSGSGIGITVGYGFTRRVSVYGQFSAANVDDGSGGDYSVGHFDLGTRLHFRAPDKTVVPYLQVGLSSRAVQQDFGQDDVEATGFGIAFGGGINAHFKPALAFTAGLAWTTGNVGNFKVNGTSTDVDSVGMATSRFNVGIVWFPQSK